MPVGRAEVYSAGGSTSLLVERASRELSSLWTCWKALQPLSDRALTTTKRMAQKTKK